MICGILYNDMQNEGKYSGNTAWEVLFTFKLGHWKSYSKTIKKKKKKGVSLV